mmetsp:Transcript_33261/g.65832  ORF Transcript_33261/g.65832 Transcript_33261/m.65832 type:complete len:98 (+) Transcript_33261:453-746(+)
MFLHLPRAKTTREKNESPTCFVSNSKLVSPYFLLLLQLYYTLADTIMPPPFSVDALQAPRVAEVLCTSQGALISNTFRTIIYFGVFHAQLRIFPVHF